MTDGAKGRAALAPTPDLTITALGGKREREREREREKMLRRTLSSTNGPSHADRRTRFFKNQVK